MTRLPYEISVVLDRSEPFVLTQTERADLRNALKKSPSELVARGYATALSSYVAHHKEQARLSPGEVRERLEKLLKCGEEMSRAIRNLTTSDRCYIGRFWTRKFLADEACISEAIFTEGLESFLDDVRSAYNEVNAMERKGAMPNFPAQALAHHISLVLYLETNKFPPLTRGGEFERLLKCALDAGNERLGLNRRLRRDVTALMQFAKTRFNHSSADEFCRIIVG